MGGSDGSDADRSSRRTATRRSWRPPPGSSPIAGWPRPGSPTSPSAAGCPPGLILYYFESKDRLLVEALTYANDQFYLRLSRELRRITSAREQLDRLIELSVPGLLPEYERLDEWALWIEIWVRALRDPALAKEREALDRRWRQSIADIIRSGREAGEFPDGVDADDLGQQIGAMIDGMAIQVMMNDTAFTPQRMRDVCRDVAAKLIGFSLEPAAGLRIAGRGGHRPPSLCSHGTHPADPRHRHRRRRRAGDPVRARLPRGDADRRDHGDGQRRRGPDDREHAGRARALRATPTWRSRKVRDGRSSATHLAFPVVHGDARAGRAELPPASRAPSERDAAQADRRDRARASRRGAAGRDRPAHERRAGAGGGAAAPGAAARVRHHGRRVRPPGQRHAGRRGEHLGRSGSRTGRVPRRSPARRKRSSRWAWGSMSPSG